VTIDPQARLGLVTKGTKTPDSLSLPFWAPARRSPAGAGRRRLTSDFWTIARWKAVAAHL